MPTLAMSETWLPVDTGETTVAVAERAALGTTARVVVWPPDSLDAALAAVDVVLLELDLQASRFRRTRRSPGCTAAEAACSG